MNAPPRTGTIGMFVDRPVLTLMCVLATVLIGVISFAKLPLRFMPSGTAVNQISIYVPVPGTMAPQEVQEKVIEPLTELVKTIPGLRKIRSNAGNGGGRVSVNLDEGMDATLASAEIRDRVQRAMLRWPAGVDRYYTWKEDASSAPLAFLQFLTPAEDSERNQKEWNHKLDQIVRTRLEAVDGVGRVDLWGLLNETIRIWFDRDRLIAHHLDFRTVLDKLRKDNFAMPVGELELDRARQSYLVRVDTKFRGTEEIESLPIRPGLVLGDIATVERHPEVQNELSRYDQKYTCSGMVRAAADANPVHASRELRKAIDELCHDSRLQGLSARFLFDQGEFIEQGLTNLVKTAIEGGVLALVVLWWFLRNASMTLVIALSIPLSLLVTGAQMFFGHYSLDICTMAGMTLAVGMVIDNAVVVLENVRRHRELGLPMRAACITGAREVGFALSMSTLTSVVVFLPMAFFGERNSRVMLGAVGIPLSTALLASLLVALLLMPSGMHALGRGARLSAAGFGRFSPLSWILWLNRALLRFGLRHRLLITIGGVALVVTAAFAWMGLEFSGGNRGPFRRGDVTIYFTYPRGTDLREAERTFVQFEQHVLAHKQEWGVQTVGGRFGRQTGRVDLFLPQQLQQKAADDLKQRVLASWPRLPGVKIDLGEHGGGMAGRSDDSEKDADNFVVRLWGLDTDYLMERAPKLQKRLQDLPEVDSVDVPAIEHNQEVVFTVDRERAQDLGVEADAIFGTMASGLQGLDLGRFEQADREVRLVAQFDARVKPSLLDLKDTRVFAAGGSYQRLADLGTVTFRHTVQSIESQDGRVNVVLVGKRKPGITPSTMTESLGRVMRDFELAPGTSWSEESVQRETQDDVKELLETMGISIVLVFLLMGVLFESVILPLSILVTIPFALLGAMWSLRLFHPALDAMAVIGMVILCGVVVNNGIVLLDYIERLRRGELGRGELNRDEAILEGVRVRMRPIFMTAAITVVGLLPTAVFGDDNEGISYTGLSIAIAGGLLVSTVFTAVAVPLAYTFADDLARGLRLLGRTVAARR
jgi:HAE1 family hydrophobic/amphiphilic exporter-1